jgi:metal-responsive CopG/Arc/MetJ family transcriptional regulator
MRHQPVKTKPISVRLSQRQYRLLDDYCEGRGINQSRAIRLALEHMLVEKRVAEAKEIEVYA